MPSSRNRNLMENITTWLFICIILSLCVSLFSPIFWIASGETTVTTTGNWEEGKNGRTKDSPWTTDRENRRWKMKSLTLSSLAWLLWDTTLLLACRVKEETKDMKNNHFSRISFTFYAYMEGITALSAVQHQLCVSMRIENEFFFCEILMRKT